MHNVFARFFHPDTRISRYARIGVLVGMLATLYVRRNRRTPHPPPKTLVIHPEQAAASGRLLSVSGAFNFRDIGGYQTTDGRVVKFGKLFRSGSLSGLTPTGQETLKQLGIQHVFDLRTEEESAMSPDILPEGIAYHHLSLSRENNPLQDRTRLLRHIHRLDELMLEAYTLNMIDVNAAFFGGIIHNFAHKEGLPALIHCTAGKDRTGVSIALVLLALGVPEETIVADYSVSNLFFNEITLYTHASIPSRLLRHVLLPHMSYLLLAHPDTLRGTLDYIHQHYGSINAYLREAVGLDDDMIEKLRQNLLE